MTDDEEVYLPSLAEIAESTARIHAGWFFFALSRVPHDAIIGGSRSMICSVISSQLGGTNFAYDVAVP